METTEYKKALALVNKGFGWKHSTFKSTGYLVLNLESDWAGYIAPNDEEVEFVINGTACGHGVIDLEKLEVDGYGWHKHMKIKEKTR